MVIRRSIRGEGITAHETFTWNKEDEKDPQIAEIMEGNTFEGMLSLIETECFAIMAEVDLPNCYGSWSYNAKGEWKSPPNLEDYFGGGWSIANTHWPIAEARGFGLDSVVGFAARMLQQIVLIKRATNPEQAGWVALQSYFLGIMRAEMRIKLEHEPKWRTGVKQHETLSDTRTRANDQRRAKARQVHSAWQEEADKIWAKRRGLTKAAVAEIICKLRGGKVNTIRQALKKPDEAG
ncbi:hypothetical protein [Edaphosphingomonas haloaromaticamans]|uniref:Uncharacterized protein n=1 Tax=Edaphosphingomonas haloaromaticamans TaxID=653954 RepID=A0A1S1H9X9_9SPHN|nr:hypothetical protein [Sphingomonas haloaromaticamans]OHT18885.1 hypothetical protein BHE75_00864 [Sphingomonas haloaromaticamans]